MPAIGWYAVVLAVSAAVTAGSCWPAAWICRRAGYVAVPGERMVHTRTTPYGGGAAMFLGFLVAMMVASAIHPLHSLFQSSSEPLGVVLAAGAIFAVGLIDDAREMSAPAKVAGEVLAASILYFLGVTLYWFKIPLGTSLSLSPSITPLIMALWVIALTNAVNLIDGLDGLAAGVVAIGGGALAVYGLRLMEIGVLSRTNIGPLIAVIACGVCIGFLPFNFHPAKMFMGDAGALLLGLLMSASTMVIGGRIPPPAATTGLTYFFFAPLLIPFFILGVPLVDMAFAFIRRTARGTGFHTPDKDHIHHRLLRLGHGHRRSVVILWAWTAILSGFILFPLFVHAVNPFIPLGVALLAVGLYTWFHPDLRHREGAVVPVAEALAARRRGVVPADGTTAGNGSLPTVDAPAPGAEQNGRPVDAPAPGAEQSGRPFDGRNGGGPGQPAGGAVVRPGYSRSPANGAPARRATPQPQAPRPRAPAQRTNGRRVPGPPSAEPGRTGTGRGPAPLPSDRFADDRDQAR
jgi:UDP-GlcNAc:undecaprenyl-phosphate/decaprenyl-phosphate GlcNAc-1-phosphate transferase